MSVTQAIPSEAEKKEEKGQGDISLLTGRLYWLVDTEIDRAAGGDPRRIS